MRSTKMAERRPGNNSSDLSQKWPKEVKRRARQRSRFRIWCTNWCTNARSRRRWNEMCSSRARIYTYIYTYACVWNRTTFVACNFVWIHVCSCVICALNSCEPSVGVELVGQWRSKSISLVKIGFKHDFRLSFVCTKTSAFLLESLFSARITHLLWISCGGLKQSESHVCKSSGKVVLFALEFGDGDQL